MKDGHYKVLHITHPDFPGQEIGSFDVIEGLVKNQEGIAEDLIQSGPANDFEIMRLANGYRRIVWERLNADPERDLPVDRSTVTSL